MPAPLSPEFERWLCPQTWVRDRSEPCVALGAPGAFDDMHLFAPCVAWEAGRYWLWYSGARGKVAERVFRLGLATSTDGVHFTRHPAAPLLAFPDGRHSILTPTLCRTPDGAVLREDGRLRLWFASTSFPDGKGLHTLHESTSADGLAWTPPSAPQLQDCYAPTILREADGYRLWYTDVQQDPWCFRHAVSADGRNWQVDPKPVLALDQAWELERLFYPTVVKDGATYLMWYGSYSHRPGAEPTTALGFAVSSDGRTWHKHPGNPVFGPEPAHAWESHYTTSQSVLRLPDGSWRVWYASRSKPPFESKYFAIGTARWQG